MMQYINKFQHSRIFSFRDVKLELTSFSECLDLVLAYAEKYRELKQQNENKKA